MKKLINLCSQQTNTLDKKHKRYLFSLLFCLAIGFNNSFAQTPQKLFLPNPASELAFTQSGNWLVAATEDTIHLFYTPIDSEVFNPGFEINDVAIDANFSFALSPDSSGYAWLAYRDRAEDVVKAFRLVTEPSSIDEDTDLFDTGILTGPIKITDLSYNSRDEVVFGPHGERMAIRSANQIILVSLPELIDFVDSDRYLDTSLISDENVMGNIETIDDLFADAIALAFDPSGDFLAGITPRQEIVLFGLKHGTVIGLKNSDSSEWTDLEFSRDGRLIIAHGPNSPTTLWSVSELWLNPDMADLWDDRNFEPLELGDSNSSRNNNSLAVGRNFVAVTYEGGVNVFHVRSNTSSDPLVEGIYGSDLNNSGKFGIPAVVSPTEDVFLVGSSEGLLIVDLTNFYNLPPPINSNHFYWTSMVGLDLGEVISSAVDEHGRVALSDEESILVHQFDNFTLQTRQEQSWSLEALEAYQSSAQCIDEVLYDKDHPRPIAVSLYESPLYKGKRVCLSDIDIINQGKITEYLGNNSMSSIDFEEDNLPQGEQQLIRLYDENHQKGDYIDIFRDLGTLGNWDGRISSAKSSKETCNTIYSEVGTYKFSQIVNIGSGIISSVTNLTSEDIEIKLPENVYKDQKEITAFLQPNGSTDKFNKNTVGDLLYHSPHLELIDSFAEVELRVCYWQGLSTPIKPFQ